MQNLLKTPEEFGAIPIRTNPDGSIMRIRDIGRTELGTESYDIEAYYNGKPTAAMAIRQAPGANALETANAIKTKLEEMSRYFPHGMKVVYPYDTTPFIEVAIQEVVKTLFEAVVSGLPGDVAVHGQHPRHVDSHDCRAGGASGHVRRVGLFGFSINMLTMFAMVLAIGLLVDDAIVVVENVERIMSEEGLSPREATAKSMDQITSALIGIGLVLSAVFGPMAFFPGSTGVIYRQFSVTIIASMLLSVVVALILTPVLCATLLRPVAKGHEPAENSFFFAASVLPLVRSRLLLDPRPLRGLGRTLLGPEVPLPVPLRRARPAVGFLFMRLPSSYLPDEDQGMLMCQVIICRRAPRWSRPRRSPRQVAAVIFKTRKRGGRILHGDRRHRLFRPGPEQRHGVRQIEGLGASPAARPEMQGRYRPGDGKVLPAIRNAMVFAFPLPAVAELGNAQGVDFQLIDRGGRGHEALMDAREPTARHGPEGPAVGQDVRPNGLEDVPEYRVDVNWEKAGAQGVPINAIHTTISAAFGSAYVNNFIQGERVKRVFVQADAPYRMLPEDLEQTVCPKQRRKDGSLCFVRLGPLDLQFPSTRTLQRLSRR